MVKSAARLLGELDFLDKATDHLSVQTHTLEQNPGNAPASGRLTSASRFQISVTRSLIYDLKEFIKKRNPK